VMSRKQLIRIIVTVAAIVAFIIFRLTQLQNKASQRQKEETHQETPGQGPAATSRKSGSNSKGLVFNRRLAKIVYTKHARCRMECRHIDESEIIEMRDAGRVNLAKSEFSSKRDPKFALEGITHDNQHVRVVFAQTETSLVVVTCIDLDNEWACSCN
jgi:cell division protein FtsI/penicillin-binding protein 2